MEETMSVKTRSARSLRPRNGKEKRKRREKEERRRLEEIGERVFKDYYIYENNGVLYVTGPLQTIGIVAGDRAKARKILYHKNPKNVPVDAVYLFSPDLEYHINRLKGSIARIKGLLAIEKDESYREKLSKDLKREEKLLKKLEYYLEKYGKYVPIDEIPRQLLPFFESTTAKIGDRVVDISPDFYDVYRRLMRMYGKPKSIELFVVDDAGGVLMVEFPEVTLMTGIIFK
jgi:DNA repair exonuclease SbcCD ATPase subunit